MENLKFALGSIVVLVLFGIGGYWAVTTMQSGSEHINTEKIKALQNENEDLKVQVEKLTNEISALQPQVKTETSVVESAQQPKPPTEKPATKTIIYKNQSLINELQKLIDDNVFMKEKSSGSRVGTVQKFLNIYNKTSNKVDNDYGASTKTAIAAFQKAQGLKADGEAGKTTFSKMIDWLKKQG